MSSIFGPKAEIQVHRNNPKTILMLSHQEPEGPWGARQVYQNLSLSLLDRILIPTEAGLRSVTADNRRSHVQEDYCGGEKIEQQKYFKKPHKPVHKIIKI